VGDPGVGVTNEPREPRESTPRSDGPREGASENGAPRPTTGERPPARPTPRRLELVISGEHGLDSEPPPEPRLEGEIAPPIVGKDEGPPLSSVHNRVATSLLSGRVPFGEADARMIRSLGGWLGLTGLATLTISAICAAQWATGRASVPSAVVAVLTFAIGLWSVLAGFHLGRALRSEKDGAHQLVRTFSNLRSIFILKAVGLFLCLALGCFAFSIVASLLALL
jgi:hypothetical protein